MLKAANHEHTHGVRIRELHGRWSVWAINRKSGELEEIYSTNIKQDAIEWFNNFARQGEK